MKYWDNIIKDKKLKCKKDKENSSFLNLICTFDTETTSIKNKNGKYAFMYIWQFSIGSGDAVSVYYGRTWTDFFQFYTELKLKYNLGDKRRLMVWVHNLGYDFQFFYSQFVKRGFEVKNAFSVDTHKVIKVDCDVLRFRDSLILKGLSLEKCAENLTTIQIEKKVGQLQYGYTRTSDTPLTLSELQYCEYDCLVLHHVIKEEVLKNCSLSDIPLTATGYVRRYYRNYIQENSDYKKYLQFIKANQCSYDVYKLLNRAFSGGYTHANIEHISETLENVSSYDFTSDYPNQMFFQKFPMSKFLKVFINECDTEECFKMIYDENTACLFEVYFINLRLKKGNTITFLSKSKCEISGKNRIDNGKIYYAQNVHTTLTDIDFQSLNQFYDYDFVKFDNFYTAKYDYLPTSLINAMLQLYTDKTILKGISGKEQEYQNAKGNLNSSYGMCVTNPLQETILFNEHTGKFTEDNAKSDTELYEQYIMKDNFLLYQWGVWITSHARNELSKIICELQNDFVYADTDSIKFLNLDKNKWLFDAYNVWLTEQQEKACKHHNIDLEKLMPTNQDGLKCQLGVFDFEGTYSKFKTLGAKRYMYYDTKKDKLQMTVSGVNKKYGVPYLLRRAEKKNCDIFDLFSLNLCIPSRHTGKKAIEYHNTEFTISVKDKDGFYTKVSESSYAVMTNSSYNFTYTKEFLLCIDYFTNNIKIKTE